MSGEITRTQSIEFTQEQRQILRDSFANGASDAEFAALLEVSAQRGLNPFKREVFFVQRWDSEKHRMVWATQVSIDGLRLVAERSGLYAGQDEPEFVENPDGSLKLCRVRVYRKDWPRPAVGVAHWDEYVQTTRDKQTGKTRPNAMWAKMGRTMLAKCAEALGIRKAFPESAAGLYTNDEMGQAQNDEPAQRIEIQVRGAVHELPERTADPDAPQGSRAWAAFVDAIARAADLGEIHERYTGLIHDLREEGHDPESYTGDTDGPGAFTMAAQRIAELGHTLSTAERTVLLGVHGADLARWIESAAQTIDTARGDRTAAAALWWVTHRGEIAPSMKEPVYMVVCRRLAKDGTEREQVVAAKRALTAAVKRMEPPPTGTDGPALPSSEAANATGNGSSAGPTDSVGDASRERVASKGGPVAYLSSKGSRREIEAAVRAHGRHVEGLAEAAVMRLDAITPADDQGARVAVEHLRRMVAAWAAEGPVAKQKAAA